MVRDGPGWSGCSHLKATALRQDSLEAGDVKTSLERLGTQDLHRSDQKIPEVAFKLESQMMRSWKMLKVSIATLTCWGSLKSLRAGAAPLSCWRREAIKCIDFFGIVWNPTFSLRSSPCRWAPVEGAKAVGSHPGLQNDRAEGRSC